VAMAQNVRHVLDHRHISLLLFHKREEHSQAGPIRLFAQWAINTALMPDLFKGEVDRVSAESLVQFIASNFT